MTNKETIIETKLDHIIQMIEKMENSIIENRDEHRGQINKLEYRIRYLELWQSKMIGISIVIASFISFLSDKIFK